MDFISPPTFACYLISPCQTRLHFSICAEWVSPTISCGALARIVWVPKYLFFPYIVLSFFRNFMREKEVWCCQSLCSHVPLACISLSIMISAASTSLPIGGTGLIIKKTIFKNWNTSFYRLASFWREFHYSFNNGKYGSSSELLFAHIIH